MMDEMNELMYLDKYCKDDGWDSQSYSGNCTLRRALLFCIYYVDWNSKESQACRVYLEPSSILDFVVSVSSSWLSLVVPSDYSWFEKYRVYENGGYRLCSRMNIEVDGMGAQIVLHPLLLGGKEQFNFIAIKQGNLTANQSSFDSAFISNDISFTFDNYVTPGNVIAANYQIANYQMAWLNISGIRQVMISNLTCTNLRTIHVQLARIKDVNIVKVTNVVSFNNEAWNGGSFQLNNIQNLSITRCRFENNSVSNMGGSIWAVNISSLIIDECNFIKNDASSFGAGAYFDKVKEVIVKKSIFWNGMAVYGSSISMSNCENVRFLKNRFEKNTALKSGAIFWVSDLMRKPYIPFVALDSINGNYFANNSALDYGENIASSIHKIKLSSWSFDVISYQSRDNIELNASLVDSYDQIVRGLIDAKIGAWIDQTKARCEFNKAILFGSTWSDLINENAQFKGLRLSCFPGGHANITFSTWVFDFSLYYSYYDYNIFRQERNMMLRKSNWKVISSDMVVKFRRCVRGEIFDIDSILKSTCTLCHDNGYSLEDNKNVYAIKCRSCPSLARSCRGASVDLFAGYWRSSVATDEILMCPWIEACKGGNMTSDLSCNPGYYGPICGNCEKGFYFSIQKTCVKCNSEFQIESKEFWVMECFLWCCWCLLLDFSIRRN